MNKSSEQILTEWLVINCQLGDADAMHELLKLWYPKLIAYAARQLNDKCKAEDAVQETLVVVSRTIGKLKEPAAFPKWLYQILHRKSVDMIRANQKHAAIYEKVERTQGQLNSDTHVCSFEQLAFDRLLEGLEPGLYQIVYLHYIEGFSMQELSELLAIPAGTVKSRLHKARKLLLDQLSK